MFRNYFSVPKWSRWSSGNEPQDTSRHQSASQIPQVLSSHVSIQIIEDLQTEEEFEHGKSNDGIVTTTYIYPSNHETCAMIRARNKALPFRPKTPSRLREAHCLSDGMRAGA